MCVLRLGLAVAQESVRKLVPDENRLRAYQRVFKWVVAYATWRYKDTRLQLREGTHSNPGMHSTIPGGADGVGGNQPQHPAGMFTPPNALRQMVNSFN